MILQGFKIRKFGLRTLLTTGLSMLLATGICSGAGFQQKCLAAEEAAPVINAGASTGEKDLEINGSALQGKADLAFIHDGLLYILDGRTGQVIKVSGSGQAIKPVWSFDGQWLAYIRLTATEADSGALWLVKRDGTQNHQVEELPGPVEPDDYAWSPHANKLALNCQGIWLADPQGQPEQLVQKNLLTALPGLRTGDALLIVSPCPRRRTNLRNRGVMRSISWTYPMVRRPNTW